MLWKREKPKDDKPKSTEHQSVLICLEFKEIYSSSLISFIIYLVKEICIKTLVNQSYKVFHLKNLGDFLLVYNLKTFYWLYVYVRFWHVLTIPFIHQLSKWIRWHLVMGVIHTNFTWLSSHSRAVLLSTVASKALLFGFLFNCLNFESSEFYLNGLFGYSKEILFA